MDRATRRSLSEKRKARAKKIVALRWGVEHLADNPKFIGKPARTPKMCSCFPMCRNARKYLGPTRQEVIRDDLDREPAETDGWLDEWVCDSFDRKEGYSTLKERMESRGTGGYFEALI